MLAKVKSVSLNGIEGYLAEIEVDINAGLPSYDLVGLAGTAIKESRERVRSAIKNSLLEYPIKRITINLAPADTKKEGPIFDLAIAIGILGASEQLPYLSYKDFIILGELSLDGKVREINGIMPLLISVVQLGFKSVIIPEGNKEEASYIDGLDIYPVKSLRHAFEFIIKAKDIPKLENKIFNSDLHENKYKSDFCEIKGQKVAKRAIEISVAGGHNILMVGPPGTGKTMLAKCVPSIMPDMTFAEAIEVTKIHSIAGILDKRDGIVKVRPFRSPHHTATVTALTGGGASSKPGEVSLAHNGVLFLDEMPEYSRQSLETLRQPLEDGAVTVSRLKQSLEYPAKFMLIASMNPCPCGNYGSQNPCKCSGSEIHRYISKLSGPLLDRIDLQVEVDCVSYEDLRGENTSEEKSSEIKKRIDSARNIQLDRFKGSNNFSNAYMNNSEMKKFCSIDKSGEEILEIAYKKLRLSARATNRILKVSRTIADLEGETNISAKHIAEAIQYRSIDRKYWD